MMEARVGESMKALVVIAHGSRSAAANAEFRALVGALAPLVPGYGCVEPAFLEAAEPSLAAAVAVVVADGYPEADVYPLFFNSGRHVASDLPALLAELGHVHATCRLRLLSHFGAWPGLADALATHLAELSAEGS